jgi:hypothetical protein
LGSDETGYSVVGIKNGFLHLMKIGGISGTGYSPDALKELSLVAKSFKVTNVIIESNFADGMFKALLEPVLNAIYPCSIDEVRHSSQKELRIIDTLEPVMNQHRLVVDEAVIKDDYESVQHLSPEKALQFMLFYQMTRLTKDKGSLAHDDRIDVLAMGVKFWLDILNVDAKKVVEDKRQQALEAELECIEMVREGKWKVSFGKPEGMNKSVMDKPEGFDKRVLSRY